MISSNDVKSVMSRHLLTDGMDIIFDLDASKGSWLVDKRNGDKYLDCFTMFASMAIGYNHPELVAIRDHLGRIAVQKPANSDMYTEEMAEFVDTFSAIGIPDYLPHLFLIEGGALAVENALKAAFDWKVRKNFAKGISKKQGRQIIHFRQAFHGRSGYTLSLTNTADPRKTKFFPTFDWPRITNPKITFPLHEHNLQQVQSLEQQALDEINHHIKEHGEDIAGLLIEPIQGEGGDNHFRNEFFTALRSLCDEHDILYILDEVQTGIGITGKFWCHEHFDARPDIICFGKKSQVCGILASTRIDEVADNVFQESSRINSTFGGNLIDMVRFSTILKVIENEQLVENAALRGRELLSGLTELSSTFPQLMHNPRGRGLMCAFDLEDGKRRDACVDALVANKLLVVGCGVQSIRFRPHLIISPREVQMVLGIIETTLKEMAGG